MARRTVRKIDFDDEEAVLAEFAATAGEDPDDLKIDDSGRGLSSFGAGTVYYVQTRGGRRGWCIAESDDDAREVALAVVRQDLDDEPELFDKNFLEQHINTDRLRRDLESDVRDGIEEELRDMRPRDFWKMADDYIDVPEEDEDGDMPDPEDYIEDMAEKITTERLRDPMNYLEDIYGSEEAVKQAIEIAGIDINAAAEDAVDTDGWQHFVGTYDGNSYETKSGLVYWRTD